MSKKILLLTGDDEAQALRWCKRLMKEFGGPDRSFAFIVGQMQDIMSGKRKGHVTLLNLMDLLGRMEIYESKRAEAYATETLDKLLSSVDSMSDAQLAKELRRIAKEG